MEDRPIKPKRKKCKGSGQMSIPVEEDYYVEHRCPVCNGWVQTTGKSFKAPRIIRGHMVEVKQ